jgi:Fe-S cluster biogenesis protein NfuA
MASRESIEATLARIRPFLQEDGGDVELVRVSDDGIVEVRLLGSCQACPMSLMTLRAGIERALLLEFPDLRRIERVR